MISLGFFFKYGYDNNKTQKLDLFSGIFVVNLFKAPPALLAPNIII